MGERAMLNYFLHFCRCSFGVGTRNMKLEHLVVKSI